MSPPRPDVLAVQIEGLRSDIVRLEGFIRESLPPLTERVEANTSWRDKTSGGLKVLMVILGIVSVGGAGWLTYITTTTIRTEQAVRVLSGAASATKAGPE